MVTIRSEYLDVVLPVRLDDSLCVLDAAEGEFRFAGVGMEDVKLHALGPSLLLNGLHDVITEDAAREPGNEQLGSPGDLRVMISVFEVMAQVTLSGRCAPPGRERGTVRDLLPHGGGASPLAVLIVVPVG